MNYEFMYVTYSLLIISNACAHFAYYFKSKQLKLELAKRKNLSLLVDDLDKQVESRKERCIELEKRVSLLSKRLRDEGFSNSDIRAIYFAELPDDNLSMVEVDAVKYKERSRVYEGE